MTMQPLVTDSPFVSPRRPPGSGVIETRGLTRYFGDTKAVDTLTLSVPRGSVFAFLGRNGSGKTTTIRILLGLLEPTRGTSAVLGQDSRALTPETRARIAYVSESHTAYKWMSVQQSAEYQSRFYRNWNTKVFEAIRGHFNLNPRAKVAGLSRGERAGLALALALAPDPELLILDDPALGLDPVARRSLLESMIYATRGGDRTIFFSSHLLEDVERVADYLAILDRSVLRACCSVETFRSHVRQFVLTFDGSAPAQLPSIRGLLRTERAPNVLRLTIAAPDESTQTTLRSVGAASVQEIAVGFNDALIGYLGDRGERDFFLANTSPTEARP